MKAIVRMKIRDVWQSIKTYLSGPPSSKPSSDQAGEDRHTTSSHDSSSHVVIFVHGLNSNTADCWLSFPKLLRADPDIASCCGRIETFEYSTGFLSRDSLDDHALLLERTIEDLNRSRSIVSLTFIAHSQGGLLARRYLTNQLARKKSGEIQHVPLFRLLTYATPHWGAFSSWLQKIVNRLPTATQVADLGYDAQALLKLNQDWAQSGADTHVDTLRVIAQNDWVVPEFSALDAKFSHYRVIPRHGHTSVVKVEDRGHPSYGIAKQFLTQRPSHHPLVVAGDHTIPVLKHGLIQSEDIGSQSQRLLYLARWIPLLGRETEWHEMERFIACPMTVDQKPIRSAAAWLWMEGVGGVGKSRLALELCLALQEADWHTGFLSRESDKQPDWTRWQPCLPTLMVVDYATMDSDFLARLLIGLCQRDPGHELRHPVRVLLLDRNDQRERLQQSIGSRALHSHVQNARHHLSGTRTPDSLSLVSVSDPWGLIEAYLKRSNANKPLPDRTTTLQALKELDPLERPLYALMVADALAAGSDLNQLKRGREPMLSTFLARERGQFWCIAANKAGLNWNTLEPYLAAATITSGLMQSHLDGFGSSVVPLNHWPDDARQVFHDVTGYDKTLSKISPLQPDLLGEFFVVQFWNTLDGDSRQHWMQWLFDVNPIETAIFLDRLGQDFPAKLALANNAVFVQLNSLQARTYWAIWIVNFIGRQFHYCDQEFADLPERGYATLRSLAAEHSSESELRLEQARAAFNLISVLRENQPEEAKALYVELKALAVAHRNKPELRVQQAQAAINLIATLGGNQPKQAMALYAELQALAVAHGNESRLQLEQAKAAVNLINTLGENQPEQARALYVELQALATAHNSEPELRLQQAKAAFNLISDLRKNQPEQAMTLYAELQALATAHNSEPELRLEQAKAIVNLIHSLMGNQPEQAMALYAELKVLAAAHSSEPELRLLQVGAGIALHTAQWKNQPEQAKSLLAELEALAAAHRSAQVSVSP